MKEIKLLRGSLDVVVILDKEEVKIITHLLESSKAEKIKFIIDMIETGESDTEEEISRKEIRRYDKLKTGFRRLFNEVTNRIFQYEKKLH